LSLRALKVSLYTYVCWTSTAAVLNQTTDYSKECETYSKERETPTRISVLLYQYFLHSLPYILPAGCYEHYTISKQLPLKINN